MTDQFGMAIGKNIPARLQCFPEEVRPFVRFINPEWLYIVLQILQMRGGDRSQLAERYKAIERGEIQELLDGMQSPPFNRYLVTTPETIADEEGEWPILQRVVDILEGLENIPAELVYLIGGVAYYKGHTGRMSYSIYENDWIPRDISDLLSRCIRGLIPQNLDIGALVGYLKQIYTLPELRSMVGDQDNFWNETDGYNSMMRLLNDEP